MFAKFYKDYFIERNHHGYYTAFMKYRGFYMQAETLKGLKAAINEDIRLSRFFTNHAERNTNNAATILAN